MNEDRHYWLTPVAGESITRVQRTNMLSAQAAQWHPPKLWPTPLTTDNGGPRNRSVGFDEQLRTQAVRVTEELIIPAAEGSERP